MTVIKSSNSSSKALYDSEPVMVCQLCVEPLDLLGIMMEVAVCLILR